MLPGLCSLNLKEKLGVGVALPFLALAGVPVPRHPGRELRRRLLSFLPLLPPPPPPPVLHRAEAGAGGGGSRGGRRRKKRQAATEEVEADGSGSG